RQGHGHPRWGEPAAQPIDEIDHPILGPADPQGMEHVDDVDHGRLTGPAIRAPTPPGRAGSRAWWRARDGRTGAPRAGGPPRPCRAGPAVGCDRRATLRGLYTVRARAG